MSEWNESAAAGWLVVLAAIVILFGGPLAQRVGETAADVAEWLKPTTAALEANAWQRQNDPRAVHP